MRMHPRYLLPLLTLAISLLAVAPASAAYSVGIGEQSPSMFDHKRFQDLDVKRVRHLVPWDWYRHEYQRAETAAFLNRAREARTEVLVTFTAPRGCFENGRYSRRKACRPPSARAYRSSFRRFEQAYPHIKAYAPWNEANHVSQPTHTRPALAVRYYRIVRRECRGCKIVAADVLDSSNVRSWLREFMRKAPGNPRIWGLHNYADVNRKRDRQTRVVLDTVPGEVWLTETGGIVAFGDDFPHSERRAANRTRYMFTLANRYDRRRSGLRSRISRVYVYQWTGAPRGTRFDSGLTDVRGKARTAYYVLRSRLRALN